MEQIVQVCVNNGLGIASFIALLFFIYKDKERNEEDKEELVDTLKNISDTMVETKIAIFELNGRIEKLEEKSDK